MIDPGFALLVFAVAAGFCLALLWPGPIPTARVGVPPRTLAGLELGETGVVVRVASACQGPARRRLLDLGVVPGTAVRATLRGAGGDPTAYDIRGATIALRGEQASWVEVAPALPREEAASHGHGGAGSR